jgi:recyclin-1
MPRLQSLVPLTPSRVPVNPATGKPLIGRLPEEAVILVLLFLPIPDIATVARCSRRLSSLCRDERVWRGKLKWLDWQGPVNDKGKNKEYDGRRNTMYGYGSSTRVANGLPGPSSSPVAETNEDDGFGDFASFVSGPSSGGPAPGTFASISLNDPPIEPKRKQPVKDDLLLLFDDVEEDLGSRSAANTSRAKRASAPVAPASPNHFGDSRSYDRFKEYHAMLLPYYLSFQQYSTNSVLFTSSDLTPLRRAHTLSNLSRFIQLTLAPTRSPHVLGIVRRNLQSAIDSYEASMLSEFEKADERNDEDSMKRIADVMWGLNGCQSLVQIFLNKREMCVWYLMALSARLFFSENRLISFYDQTHNPLKNLMLVAFAYF